VVLDNGLAIDDIDYFEPGYLEIMFQISNLCTAYHRYPDSLVMGLSRIGGLFFFLSLVGVFLYFGHLLYF
jgi:apolipoprotein N-acyltransferase